MSSHSPSRQQLAAALLKAFSSFGSKTQALDFPPTSVVHGNEKHYAFKTGNLKIYDFVKYIRCVRFVQKIEFQTDVYKNLQQCHVSGFLGSRQLYAYIVCLELYHVYFLFLKNLNEKQIKNCFDVIKKQKQKTPQELTPYHDL